MTKSYRVTYKSKSKMLKDAVSIEKAENEIKDIPNVKAVKITEEGQVVSIEADEENFSLIMNKVVNVFKRIDDKSEVAYSFGLNMNN